LIPRRSLLLALVTAPLLCLGLRPAAARPLTPSAHVDITIFVQQPDGTIAPLAGAHALLGNPDGAQVGLTSTDAAGQVSLDVTAGIYSLIIFADGYEGTGHMVCGDPDWDTQTGRAGWGDYQVLVENPLVLMPGGRLCRQYLFTPRAPAPDVVDRSGGVYLTFDDGYVYLCETVQLVIDLGIHATFFLTGQAILSYPDCVRRLVAAGNRLGNHTYAHDDLTKLSQAGIIRTLQATEDAAQRVAGVSTKPWCRPPSAAVNDFVRRVAADWGCRMVMWDRDTRDWSGISARAIENTALAVRCRGEIVLFHTQAYLRDRAALPDIVAALRAAGCEPAALGG
jgi:peptidoglycan/xylan/chitin deacetylase (PgdA/CDA1 family)